MKNIGGAGTAQKVTLQFWGVFDGPSAFNEDISQFKIQHPGIDIIYRQFNYDDYEKSLVDALAASQGPDILMINNTWLPKHKAKLMPLPDKIPGLKAPLLTIADYKSQFVDVVYDDLVDNGKIYGLPLYMDTLALFYNKDLFNSAGISTPPQSWDEFNSDVQKLTKIDGQGNFIQSGAALGTARNINRSTDILGDLMIQSGVQMTSSDHTSATFSGSVSGQKVGQVALQYYTDFARPDRQTYTWNDFQHYSIDAFTEGKVAMMFNYAYQIPTIRAKAPRLNFAMAAMPQVSTSDVKNFANYWAVAVSNKSSNYNQAWQFISYLTSNAGAKSYLSKTIRPSARRDLIDSQRSDVDLGVFAVQALSAKSWYEIDNVAIENIFADMIDDVNYNRSTITDALDKAESRINVLMQKK